MLNLYFAPLACSLATRIALYEAGANAEFTQVDLKAKRTAGGADFFAVTEMGQVPVLRTEDGALLSENTAVLQYVAERFPQSGLAPERGVPRARLQQWLGFIGTELHKGVFASLLDPHASDAAKSYAREKLPLRFAVLEKHFGKQEYLLDRFSIADAYLTTILNWTFATGVDLAGWPALKAYHQRMLQRPAIAKAFAEELELYKHERAREQAGRAGAAA